MTVGSASQGPHRHQYEGASGSEVAPGERHFSRAPAVALMMSGTACRTPRCSGVGGNNSSPRLGASEEFGDSSLWSWSDVRQKPRPPSAIPERSVDVTTRFPYLASFKP